MVLPPFFPLPSQSCVNLYADEGPGKEEETPSYPCVGNHGGMKKKGKVKCTKFFPSPLAEDKDWFVDPTDNHLLVCVQNCFHANDDDRSPRRRRRRKKKKNRFMRSGSGGRRENFLISGGQVRMGFDSAKNRTREKSD